MSFTVSSQSKDCRDKQTDFSRERDNPPPFSLTGKVGEFSVLEFMEFQRALKERLSDGSRVISFFGSPSSQEREVYLNAVVAKEETGALQLIRTRRNRAESYPSLTLEHPELQCFEREIYEQYGIRPSDHPWLKPIRFPGSSGGVETYPFYQLEGKEVHEVGVGPIHAGVIEPGHFRFMCYGEKVHHLEIQLGYQHRDVEKLLLGREPWKLTSWIETISGDSSIAHTWAYCTAWENLCGMQVNWSVRLVRGIALELERIAMHLAGLAGMATDIGFLPGGAVYGRLRTTAINSSMRLCGSRFGRGWLRPGEVRCVVNAEIIDEIHANLKLIENDIQGINDLFTDSKTVQHRLKGTGRISRDQAILMGFVGMAARSTGIPMDLRRLRGSIYRAFPFNTIVEESGDCWARALVRIREIDESLHWLLFALEELKTLPATSLGVPPGANLQEAKRNSFSVALIEGWRGEVVHYLETDSEGRLAHYKVQDPSLRNWFALALAVRNNDISDFPICNKSFDLSYCGHDL